jgi:hypothetical protein
MLTTTDGGAERAARAIIELINSRPASPRQDEIVAIITRLAVERITPAPASSADCDALDREYGPIMKYSP